MFIKSSRLAALAVAGCLIGATHTARAAEQGGATAEQKKPATGAFCGGIAAITCTEGLVCVDDPKDTCDPTRGGADCGGICVSAEGKKPKKPRKNQCNYDNPAQHYIAKSPDECATIRFLCEEGTRPFFNSCGCGCRPGA